MHHHLSSCITRQSGICNIAPTLLAAVRPSPLRHKIYIVTLLHYLVLHLLVLLRRQHLLLPLLRLLLHTRYQLQSAHLHVCTTLHLLSILLRLLRLRFIIVLGF